MHRFSVFVLPLLFVLGSGYSVAHEIRPAIVNINLNDAGYHFDLLLNLEAIMAEVGSDTKIQMHLPMQISITLCGCCPLTN